MDDVKALPEPKLYTTLNYSGPVPFMTRDLYQLGSDSTLLSTLIKDRAANHPIFFGTDDYEDLSETFSENSRMSEWRMRPFLVNEDKTFFQARSQKEKKIKTSRTKKRGEVVTPLGIVNQMIDVLEEGWKDLSLNDYLSQTVLELCCGEAPFLVQRYDPITGELLSVDKRRGILDRKLHQISKNTNSQKTWRDWGYQAYRSTYGYEYQGDSLFLGRENLLFDYIEHYFAKFHELPPINEINRVAAIISWNLFQMDGIKNEVPYFDPHQQKLFETGDRPHIKPLVTLWKSKGHEPKNSEKKRYGEEDMKFDVVIGNPAYQENSEGTRDRPIYDSFIDESYKVAKKVVLITPARFLFNAGATPKIWNKKMLNDPHLKVIRFEQDGRKIFPGTDIKGGVVITFHDHEQIFGEIGTFTSYPELNEILRKIKRKLYKGLNEIMTGQNTYKFTPQMHEDFPDAIFKLSKGHENDIGSSVFQRLPEVFFDQKPNDELEYISIIGREKSQRTKKFIKRKYVNNVKNLDAFKIFLPKSNGTGKLGETLSAPFIAVPEEGATQTFLSIGNFQNIQEAENCLKYIKSKFARALLGILKITQDNPPEKWKYVPLQDFTENSDIDWSKSIPEIDQQLYTKYGLSDKEINFIETHVKEMI